MTTSSITNSTNFVKFFPQPETIKTIAKIVLPILLLGIAGKAVCSLVSRWITSIIHSSEQRIRSNIYLSRISPTVVPYSEAGREALEFARTKLEQHRDNLTPAWQDSYLEKNRPINPELSLFQALHQKYKDKLRGVLESTKTEDLPTVYRQEAVIKIVDKCMKTAFTVSNLMLDEFHPFFERHCNNESDKEYFQRPDKAFANFNFCYTDQAFYVLPDIYERIRFEKVPQSAGIFNAPKFEACKDLFYQKDTTQFQWRQLYNEFGRRFHATRPPEPKEGFSERFERRLAAVERDTSPDIFKERHCRT